MGKIFLSLAVAVALLTGVALHRGGWPLLWQALLAGGETFVQVLPLLVLAFVSAGLVSVVTGKEETARWLGEGSGWRGILIGTAAGALVPGGPFVYFPVAAAFLASGASIGSVVGFVTAKNLWSLSRLPLEFALLGPEITLARFGATMVFPPLAGFAADAFYTGRTPRIREQIRKLQHIREDEGQ